MFQQKSKSDPNQGLQSISIISADSNIKGDMESDGDIRIDGKLIGNINCKAKIIVGQQGIVEGNLNGNQADVLGTVNGDIKMTGQLNLLGKSIINGNIHVGKLQMESTVTFNGKCIMGEKDVVLSLPASNEVDEY
jgi:cytoskeletal protein CcmA (bactofilin family)